MIAFIANFTDVLSEMLGISTKSTKRLNTMGTKTQLLGKLCNETLSLTLSLNLSRDHKVATFPHLVVVKFIEHALFIYL